MDQDQRTREHSGLDAQESTTQSTTATATGTPGHSSLPGLPRTLRHRATCACAVLAAAGLLASCGGSKAAHPATSPSGRHPVISIAMPSPGSVETAFGSVWVTNGDAQTLTRLNPQTNAVIARIQTPGTASVVGVGAGAVWVTSFPGNSLTRIDPADNRVTQTISLAPRGTGPDRRRRLRRLRLGRQPQRSADHLDLQDQPRNDACCRRDPRRWRYRLRAGMDPLRRRVDLDQRQRKLE